jgi:hypothetical protein
MDFVKPKENALIITKEPLAGYSINNILRLLAQNRFRISIPYLPRVLYSVVMSSVMAPFRVIERIKYDKTIHQIPIREDPVFLLGHWRGGTTYVHNVLSLDQNLGYFSTYHAYLPGIFWVGEQIFKPILVSSLPEKRPMDDVMMGAELPQEEEYSVGGLSPFSYYQGWCFPQNMKYYNKFVCLNAVSPVTLEKWKKMYLYLVKKATLYNGGRRLVTKNPANTARIKQLLELFPDAKFIHIYRNPYHVYYSMMRFMGIVIPLYCVQTPPPIEEVEKTMMELYAEMHQKYLSEREYIPDGNLIEIRYENFITQPLEETKRIYNELHLGGFKESEQVFKKFIASQANIKTHDYIITEEVRRKVSTQWGFVFDAFGYEQ